MVFLNEFKIQERFELKNDGSISKQRIKFQDCDWEGMNQIFLPSLQLLNLEMFQKFGIQTIE